ncbi:MAG: hypothetical protein HZB51_13950 [Chloroflexi bacterium]|nr:hypothetical protein [Chloroflexota bacterium]
MKIERSGFKLVLRHSPGCFWMLALFFVAIAGIFVLGPLGLFSNRDEVPALGNLLSFGMGCIGVAAGIYIWRSAPFTTVVIDRLKSTVQIQRGWLFTKSQVEYTWRDIAWIFLAETQDSEGDWIYRIEMNVQSGECVPLFEVWVMGKAEYESAVRAIHDFGCGASEPLALRSKQ